MTAEVCREVGPRPKTPVARAAACVPVRREAVSPGKSGMTDDLPGTVASGPPVLLTYRIQLFNAAGRSAGESVEAGFAAGGAAPAALEGLRVSSREAGAVLEWTRPRAADSSDGSGVASADVVELDRVDLTAPASTKTVTKTKSGSSGSKSPGGKMKTGAGGAQPQAARSEDQPNEVRLRVPAGAEGAGTLDQSIAMGETYRYTAELVRTVTVGTHTVEMRSAPSNAVQLARIDSFPPADPAGLAAIPAESGDGGGTAAAKGQMFVDLSWEPNGEVDLAGYLVSRQLVDAQGTPVGAVERLNQTPLAAPAFRDLTVVAGQGYQYRVTAVDQSGNRSAASEPVNVTVTP